jgi:hypothetical protein
MTVIRSALRPASDDEARWPARLLHEQYDRLFKSMVSGQWANESNGDVDSITGYFALIIIEPPECEEAWNAFANEDTLDEGQLKWMWSGQLAGYYVTREDSNGLIFVTAYDDVRDARQAMDDLNSQYNRWADEVL